MCGIIGGVSNSSVVNILLDGLKRLEYRGYDSAGIATLAPDTNKIQRIRVAGKVINLAKKIKNSPLTGHIGIAHTRWATHGAPNKNNAHPHCSNNQILVVHNGIIENHEPLKQQLLTLNYAFSSDTDSEVIAHLIHHYCQTAKDTLTAIYQATAELVGAYAIAIINTLEPKTLYVMRSGSPLVIGTSTHGQFVASDPMSLLPVTQDFISLEEGDVAKIQQDNLNIYNKNKRLVKRKKHSIIINHKMTDGKGKFRHYMQKEIFEQPQAISDSINAYLNKENTSEAAHIKNSPILRKTKRIHIAACGTSYHAALVGKYWIEAIAQIPCQVEIASEQRYRPAIVEPNTLFIALSQSGETADTLEALKQAKKKGYFATLSISNTAQSSLVREADLALLTHAGPEVGVAATKTFTTQLIALFLLTAFIQQSHSHNHKTNDLLLHQLKKTPALIKKILTLDPAIKELSKQFNDKDYILFLGRGMLFPIALEGALKLKEISYMHAEAYPAGELKHGPLALIDKGMPVIVIAPNDKLIQKLLSNMEEARSRGAKLYLFMDHKIDWKPRKNVTITQIPSVPEYLVPIIYTIPLQLLSYHIAILKGTDIDQPRNLAKSVTVE